VSTPRECHAQFGRRIRRASFSHSRLPSIRPGTLFERASRRVVRGQAASAGGSWNTYWLELFEEDRTAVDPDRAEPITIQGRQFQTRRPREHGLFGMALAG